MRIIFPDLRASNLEGRKFEFPRDFEGVLVVVIIAFKMEQQAMVDGWSPFLDSLIRKYSSLKYYEMPTIHYSYKMFRWMIDGGMRAGIAYKRLRERTITSYLNKKRFKQQLEIHSEDTIHILLIRSGEIIWRTVGSFENQKGDDLERAVKENIS